MTALGAAAFGYLIIGWVLTGLIYLAKPGVLPTKARYVYADVLRAPVWAFIAVLFVGLFATLRLADIVQFPFTIPEIERRGGAADEPPEPGQRGGAR